MSEQLSPDGLLAAVDESEYAWLAPNFGEVAREDVLSRAVEWIGDVLQQLYVAWPAQVGGRLVVPPAAHVLDALTRLVLHVGGGDEWDVQWTLRPTAGTVALMSQLPRCDVPGCGNDARYDDMSPLAGDGAASLCPSCYLERSKGELGVGRGQLYLRYSEVPDYVWDAALAARLVWENCGAPVSPASFIEQIRPAVVEPFVL